MPCNHITTKLSQMNFKAEFSKILICLTRNKNSVSELGTISDLMCLVWRHARGVRVAMHMSPQQTFLLSPFCPHLSKEYLKSRNIPLASQHIGQARFIAPLNPEALHQYGVVLFENEHYADAAIMFQKAVGDEEEEAGRGEEEREASLFNWAQCLRKLKQ